VYGLVLLEFEKESVEGFQVVGWGVGIEVEYGREGEAQKEVVGRTAGKVSGCEGGQACEVVFGEEKRVEPVYAAFVAGRCQYAGLGKGSLSSRCTHALRR
jgi:hypothetical protein